MRAKAGRLLSIKELLLHTQSCPESVNDVLESLRAVSKQEPCSETQLDREREPDFAVRSAA
jgi:hypothetical protein